MISKSELDEFAKAWTAQTAWADDFDFEETSPIVRRQSSWSDIMKRERVGEIKKEVKTSKREEEEAEEVVKDLDCAICFDCFTPKDACSTTPCGHKFHSACLFRNFEHRPECPLCRTELIKQPEEEDDDDFQDAESYPSNQTLSLEAQEIEMIKRALVKNHGKRKKAADELGISERTLYRKIKQYELED